VKGNAVSPEIVAGLQMPTEIRIKPAEAHAKKASKND
jgi:hypothetical protein